MLIDTFVDNSGRRRPSPPALCSYSADFPASGSDDSVLFDRVNGMLTQADQLMLPGPTTSVSDALLSSHWITTFTWKALILGNAAHGATYYASLSRKVGAKNADWVNPLTFHQCFLSQNPRNSPVTLSTAVMSSSPTIRE